MSNDELQKGLRRLISSEGSSQFGRMTQLAGLCGCLAPDLYNFMRGERPLPDLAKAQLTEFLPRLERGEIRFFRRSTATGNQNTKNRRQVEVTWEVEYLEPPEVLPPPQPRVIPAKDFRQWARCGSCGGPRFSGFVGLGSRHYMACDSCVGAADRRMLGA